MARRSPPRVSDAVANESRSAWASPFPAVRVRRAAAPWRAPRARRPAAPLAPRTGSSSPGWWAQFAVSPTVRDLHQHRHHALLALAGHGDDVAFAGYRKVFRRQAERLGNAQPDPSSSASAAASRARPRARAGSPARNPVSVMLLRTCSRRRLRQVFEIFGVRTAASAPTLPLPLFRGSARTAVPASDRIRERPPIPCDRRDAMKPRSRPASGPSGPRRSHACRGARTELDELRRSRS